MPEPILFTHTDLDGVTCAILFKAVYPRGEVHFCDYGVVNAVVVNELASADPDRPVLITDISVESSVAEFLDRRGNVVLLDHHKTAEWLNKHRWAKVQANKSGAALLYEFLCITNYADVDVYDDLVARADDYDRWIHKWPESRWLSRLLGIIGRHRFMDRFLQDPVPELTKSEKMLLDLDDEAQNLYFKRIVEGSPVLLDEVNGETVRYTVVFAERYVSDLGHYLINALGLDYVVMLDLQRQTAGIRGAGRVDCSALAKERGGGGHHDAAGFPLDPQLIEEFRTKVVAGCA